MVGLLDSTLMDDCRSETSVAPQQQERPGFIELHQVDRHDARMFMLNFKLPPRIPSQALTRVFDDDRSVASGKSRQPLLSDLFFQNASVKVTAPIGEASLSDNYPLCDKPWSFWIAEEHTLRGS